MKAPFGGVAFGVLAACSFRSPAGDLTGDASHGGDAPTTDAADVDAATDAAPFACNFPGVQCPGGIGDRIDRARGRSRAMERPGRSPGPC
jgi:hypothetical protein